MTSDERTASLMTGDDFLAESLRHYGVTTVFMVPVILPHALAKLDSLGVNVVMTHGEKAAAYMADGYARASRRPGVAMAQAVGGANLAAGLRDPYLGGAPVIAITGGPRALTRHRNAYQEIDDLPLFDQVTKGNFRIDDVRRVPDLLRQAFRVATSGAPGPVHLELAGITGDILRQELDVNQAGPFWEPDFRAAPAFRPLPDTGRVREALRLIAGARRPAIVAGGGVRTSGAGAELVEFATRLRIPVATSLNGKACIDERDELAVGVVGSYSRTSANAVVAAADLVVFVGSRTGTQTTDNFSLPPTDRAIIQIDIEPVELGRNYPNTLGIVGDAKRVLEALIAESAAVPSRPEWLGQVSAWVAEWRRSIHAHATGDVTPIRPERLCSAITSWLPDDAVLVSDTGHAAAWSGALTDLRPGQMFLRAAGSLGWGLPAAMGAKAALPDRPVVCFTGDGGFYYHLAELETAARHGLCPVIVVNDNRSLNQDKAMFARAYNGEISQAGDRMWRFTDVDLASVARGLGCVGIRVEDPRDIDEALRAALACGRPAVVDVLTDIDALPPRPRGGRSFYDN